VSSVCEHVIVAVSFGTNNYLSTFYFKIIIFTESSFIIAQMMIKKYDSE